MTTDENIMQEMLDRATNPSREVVDELSLEMFCLVVRSNAQLVDKAQEMILSKIRSTDVSESTRAISLLEECMTKCGVEFQNEASKFRFLNELIRLVSKNHRGPETPTAIKQRIMECLLLWTTEFPQRTKIREVYDMLRIEGVEFVNNPVAEAKRENVLGIDEDMLKKLIKSNDPENFKRANLLIQYRVSQDARRTEFLMQHKSILQEVENTTTVLNEMLNTFEAEGVDEVNDGNETLSLMRDLYKSCKKHKPILERLPALMENLEASLIIETVEANENLQVVMRRYTTLVARPTKEASAASDTLESTSITDSVVLSTMPSSLDNTVMLSDLLDIVPPETGATTTSVLPERDFKILDTATIGEKAAPVSASINSLDELSAIFGEANTNTANSEAPKNLNEIFGNLDLLTPVSVFSAKNSVENTVGTEKRLNISSGTEKCAFRELPAIDKLSEDLFKQSLQTGERLSTFKKIPERCTLNDLVKVNKDLKPESLTTSPSENPKKSLNLMDEQAESIKVEHAIGNVSENLDDDVMLTVQTEETNEKTSNVQEIKSESPKVSREKIQEFPLKHLSEISIDLDDVIVTPDERVLMDDDDVKLTLTFTENRPTKQVSLIVLTAFNKSKLPVQDFQFEASVRKPCKVRLLPPTAVMMPSHKPFRPATPINQVMLLLNPTGKSVDVTCIVGYKLGDDPDPIKDSIIVKNIPYAE